MIQKIKIDDKDYKLEGASEQAKRNVVLLQFVTNKIQELKNMEALLERAKGSYANSLKTEVLSSKSGLIFDD